MMGECFHCHGTGSFQGKLSSDPNWPACPHCSSQASAINALEAENKRLREALEFYANRDSYRNRSVAEQRELEDGRDPVVAASGVGSAPPGCALSDIQKDRQGGRARDVLASKEQEP